MRVITDDEANKGNKGLIMVDNCFHMTHLTCFKKYCQKVLLTRQANGDFCDAKCAKCQSVIDEANLRELLGPQELSAIREMQFNQQSQMAGFQVVECPCCHAKFEFEPSKNVDYKAKDDTGKTVSRQTAEHMAKYRVRCGFCKENFCVNCNISPYHINMSCDEAARKAKALKCRFCLEELKEPSLSRDPNF